MLLSGLEIKSNSTQKWNKHTIQQYMNTIIIHSFLLLGIKLIETGNSVMRAEPTKDKPFEDHR